MAPVAGRVSAWIGVLLLAGLGSCRSEPVAVVRTGAIVTDDWKDKALTAEVSANCDAVWSSVCQTLSLSSMALLDVDEADRRVRTTIEDAFVSVHVRQWELDQTRIYVEAQKYMLHSPEVAQLVMERIVSDLADTRDHG